MHSQTDLRITKKECQLIICCHAVVQLPFKGVYMHPFYKIFAVFSLFLNFDKKKITVTDIKILKTTFPYFMSFYSKFLFIKLLYSDPNCFNSPIL